MLSESELMQAIEDLEKEPFTLAKISKLADFCAVYDHFFGQIQEPGHNSFSSSSDVISTDKSTEFLAAIDGKRVRSIIFYISDLVESVRSLYPKIYDKFMADIRSKK